MSTNPYEPPKADGAPPESADELTKDQRVNLINRRTVAYLIELMMVTPVTAFGAAFLGAWFSWVGFAAYVLVRDVIGTAAFAKRVVGLDLANASGGVLTTNSRILRNVPLAIPLFPLIEYFVAYYGNNDMQRLGDKYANTRIVDLAPDTKGQGSWTGQLVLALIGSFLVNVFVAGAIIAALI